MVTIAPQQADATRTRRDHCCQQLVDSFFERISRVSSLPTAVVQVLEITADHDGALDDLLRVLETDPPMAARILRLANSSFYSPRTAIRDLRTAVALLGFREIRNLAMTAHLSGLLSSDARYRGYSRLGLWNHSASVGAVSRILAARSRRVMPGEAYLAGLLHDFGLILLDQYLRRPFTRVLDHLSPERPTCEVEWTILGFDHTELGAYVATRWRFPEPVTAAIRYHHEPAQYTGTSCDIVHIVAMANFLCALRGRPSLGVHNLAEPPGDVVSALNFRPDDILTLKGQLGELFARESVVPNL